ncbi:histidine kinase dimerization/phosphoacceptor domain -containing protein [Teichococcus wenyumeiae]|uniref:histidine kinase dimerization/phosphoacceptor domain -containing protein n=1 Tax=Teichococcus wenyumeiae TaxID=2478470 RepID=UPI001314AA6B|nr:histidine kinase dimerization/phosphoacceptor domain -containing protein [Pseudoroseomonas wenyumeiae]
MDLANCDREPIHIPGAIQPHGILLVVEPTTEAILQMAGDLDGLVGRGQLARGRSVGDMLGISIDALARSAGVDVRSEPVYLGSVKLPGSGSEFDVIAHRSDGVVLLELEPAPTSRPSAAHLLASIRAIATSLEAAPDLLRTCQTAARGFRRITGFERVMVYRFLEDGSGTVFAEDKAAGTPSLLNHHYPASDIPRQARELYVRSPIRAIPDADYAPAPLTPEICPATGRPLDMSDCSLRSVSPIHLQYLKNFGVTASMSVSIVRGGDLWGLVSCHHTTPKAASYEIREACKHLGQILSQQIAAREDAEAHAQGRRMAERRDEVLLLLTRANRSAEDVLAEHAAELRDIVPCDGVAVCRRGRIVAGVGCRPSNAEIERLAEWLPRGGSPDPYATNHLSEQYAPAADYRARASGLLATVISHEEQVLLLWFRAEQVEVINWAGNPHKPVEPGVIPGVLTPRASFELWRETVHGRSHPWTPEEIDTTRRFRDAVFRLRQQQRLEDLNRRLRETLSDKDHLITQKDLLMREVHHRVQNSLQLVNSMLGLQEREMADPLLAAGFAEARRRIFAVSAVHRRLWRSDQIQSIGFDTYMRELHDGLVQEWGSGWREHIKIWTTPVLVPTEKAVILALVVTELLTNAVKHAYEGAVGPIDITVGGTPNGGIKIAVADQGKGMKREERPGGFGSRLTRLLTGQIGGKINFEDNRPGTRVVLSVPLSALCNDYPASGVDNQDG